MYTTINNCENWEFAPITLKNANLKNDQDIYLPTYSYKQRLPVYIACMAYSCIDVCCMFWSMHLCKSHLLSLTLLVLISSTVAVAFVPRHASTDSTCTASDRSDQDHACTGDRESVDNSNVYENMQGTCSKMTSPAMHSVYAPLLYKKDHHHHHHHTVQVTIL